MIKININGEEGKRYRIQKSRFWELLLREKYVRINLLCSILFVVSACVILIFCINEFARRIYSTPQAYVNAAGAIVNTLNNKEITLWLYNPSQIMANSGIRVAKGDRIRISASGTYHAGMQSEENIIWKSATDSIIVDGLVFAARKNVRPTFPWISQYNQGNEGWIKRLFIQFKTDCKDMEFMGKKILHKDTTNFVNALFYENPINLTADYGTLLVGIMNEFDDPHCKMNVEDKTIAQKKEDYRKSLHFDDLLVENLKPAYEYREWTTVQKGGVLHFNINDSRYNQAFYTDNLGEILVCVEVEYPTKNKWILYISLAIMIIIGLYPFMYLHVKDEKFKKACQYLFEQIDNVIAKITNVTIRRK